MPLGTLRGAAPGTLEPAARDNRHPDFAVLGSGLRNIYPREHAHFVEDMIQHGCVLSEVPPSTPPQAAAFPRRNRIVSGLCVGTLVIQASERSGALITARLAGEQGVCRRGAQMARR